MAEQAGTGRELSADPTIQSGVAPLTKEDHQDEVVSSGVEANTWNAGALLNGRFELIKCVGAGGMSRVYKALDRQKLVFEWPAPYVAIKVLNQRFQADPKRLAALQQEVERCQRMVHPNILQVHEFHRDGATVYMTMEYLYGQPLTQRIRRKDFRGLPPEEALRIIKAMGQALAYVHSQGIVHCDFKPGNVFLTDSGEVKLIDFGIAQAFGAPEELAERAVSPAYASLQVMEGRAPDPRDDVYALACTAYELLTGVHPFDYRPATEARQAALTVTRREGLSRLQWKALRGALAFERAKRTATVERFLEEFNTTLFPWRPERSKAIAVGVAAYLLMVGGVLWWRASGPLSEVPRAPLKPEIESAATSPRIRGTDSAIPVSRWQEPERGTAGPARQSGAVVVGLKEQSRVHAEEAEPAAGSAVADVSSKQPTEQREAVPPAQGPASGQGQRVAELLSQAERQLAAKQLTTPPGDNALESYRQVLQRVPGHEEAQKGIERITGRYQAWAKHDQRRGNWDRAEAHLKKGLAIAPGDPRLQAALGASEEARRRRDERARRLISEREAIRQEREKETSGAVRAQAERDELTWGAKAQVIARSEEEKQTMENDAVREAQASKAPAPPPNPPAPQIAKSEPTATKPAVPSKLRSPVVINEFMAGNQQTIANRLGGYGDWIEIYNPNAETVDLSGHYLSNDATNPEQWRFPKGTVIRGRGHLLIWADKRSRDTTPSEIHTNFDLSRMGDQIVLTDDKKKVVDSVRFGRQREDVSLGKGAGSRPTPGR